MRDALTREQVKQVIERRGNPGVPVFMGKWWGEGLEEVFGPQLRELEDRYPEDICAAWYQEPGYDRSPGCNPEYRFGFTNYDNAERHSIGETVVLLEDWDDLDTLMNHFPDPNEPGNFAPVHAALETAGSRYRLGCWWRLFHERFWSIRGMENLMMDYYDNMEGLRLIGERLVEFYKVIITRFAELGFDGIFSSDDLGHQSGPMMSPAVFKELYLPLYKEVIGFTHQKGMHFWLHSCGDNSLLMDDLIEAGLDVFHPVQKGCMDMPETAKRFGGRISFLAGMDVQSSLVLETPENVRAEIRGMKQVFDHNGGLLLAMGNGIMPGTPLENIRAALDEMYGESDG